MPKGYRTYAPRFRSRPQSEAMFECESQPYIPSQPSYNSHVRSNRCRLYGIIKVYFLDRGYGFIRGNDGQEYFFRTKNGFVLKSGMKVGFEIENDNNAQKAVRVTYNGKQVN